MRFFSALSFALTLSVSTMAWLSTAPVLAAPQGQLIAATITLSPETQELQDMLARLSGFSAHFKQEVSDQEGKSLSTSEGSIYLLRPDHFMMHTTAPDELALYTQDHDIYYYDAVVNQVSIFSMSNMLANPLMLLVSSDEAAWAEYAVSRDGNRFTLVPKTRQDVRSLTIAFAEKPVLNDEGEECYLLEALTIRMDDGNNNFYIFSQQQATADAEDFNFALPADVEVDDAR